MVVFCWGTPTGKRIMDTPEKVFTSMASWSKPPSKKELRQAQAYTIGQNELGLESTTNQIMWMGESLLAYDKVVDPDEVQAKFKEVTAEQIQEVANLCFAPQRMGLGIVGPVEGSKVERWIGDIGY